MYEENPPLDELYHYILLEDGDTFDEKIENYLMHYGIKYRSGRYPYGSGENPYQHDAAWLNRVRDLRDAGFTWTDPKTGKTYSGDTAIARSMDMSSTEFRVKYKYEKNLERTWKVDTAKSLRDDGLNTSEIARKMGVTESTVRGWFKQDAENRMKQGQATAEFLKERLKETGKFIDVGSGVNRELNISQTQLDEALYSLQQEGYEVWGGRIEQPTNPGQATTVRVLCPPGTEHKEIFNTTEIGSVADYISRDDGQSFMKKFTYPESLNSDRLMIRYAEDGGKEMDGVIQLRRNVDDLSLGDSLYSQVRILVDGDRYLKGMAVYSDNMPDGVDVIFNTNKSKGTDMRDVLKKIKDDPDNPFGSNIKDADQGGQYEYTDKETGEKKLGLINKRSDESDWSDWSNRLPAQFLSKQTQKLADQQLKMAITDKTAELKAIQALDNPTVKKQLLTEFASSCDSDAVHLYAAALPGQKYHVILPITSLKDTEIYAPNYDNGTKLALIRYPHGGTFEIPILTVNNKNKDAIKTIGSDAEDAVGITSKVAERLSGADFDGDTVMCIPVSSTSNIKSTPALKGLEGFDPKIEYAGYEGMTKMTKHQTQIEMGKISNLITDMTIKGADENELAKAVKHSMVVIDAEKHGLDYKKSYVDNGIQKLKEDYQGEYDEDGKFHTKASTIVSRAKNRQDVVKRQGQPKVNLEGTDNYDPTRPEGALLYKTSDNATYTITKTNKKTGEVTTETRTRKEHSTQMAETDDAYTLVSKYNTPMERAYAAYANKLKSMANEARKEAATTGKIEYKKESALKYKTEVDSLITKLKESQANTPRERQALMIANGRIKAKVADNPSLKNDKEQYRKVKQQEMSRARDQVGASRKTINITDNEWTAIQKGAISENKLKQILNYADKDRVRELATPRSSKTITTAQQGRIRNLSKMGYTNAEIAAKLGISASSVAKYLK